MVHAGTPGPRHAWPLLIVVLGVAGLVSPAAEGQEGDQYEEGFNPAELYGPMMSDEPEGADRLSAAAGIAAWARQPPVGPEGRPLPLTGSWMAEGMFGPNRFVEMIEDGHHVLITFLDPVVIGKWSLNEDGEAPPKWQRFRSEHYRSALEYAREHNLPIAFRGWNWGHQVGEFDTWRERWGGETVPPEQSAYMLKDGKRGQLIDPFGPVDAWRTWGAFWFSHDLMREIQEIYPNPPMVIFLNNAEGPKVRHPSQMPDDYDRMIAELGERPSDEMAKARAIRAGYQKRYAAMFEAARDALVEPAWKENVKFVAYNNLWDTGYIGQGNRPQPDIWFERDEGWLQWRMYDGGMPELYDNDWQLGKTDYTPWSPQTEAMNYFAVQQRIFDRDPDFYWSTIVWDGGRVGDVWRGRGRSAKTFWYVSRGQQWDFSRYEGWVQFSLWATRPRTMREFRYPSPERHAYMNGTWMALVRSVDRPWNHDVLREFWKFGELVPNRDEEHWFDLSEDQPQWIRELERWYLLTCDANPPRETWENRTRLRVFALALVLGEAPQRRWLVYAHAPLGAVADATVQLPGYGSLTLDAVPRSGSFFLVDEAQRSARKLITGGPAEIALTPDGQQWVEPGTAVRFEAKVTHPARQPFTVLRWSIAGQQVAEQPEPGSLAHTFNEPGAHMVTVTARTSNGDELFDQTMIFVGPRPAEAVLYDLALDEPFAWEGPWDDSGAPDHELVTYRHLPNRGSAPPAVVSGGTFVDDAERGAVLELDGPLDAVHLIRDRNTVLEREGYSHRTIALWFKAQDTETRQVLYADGFQAAGYNIYLDRGKLYAGAWAPVDGRQHNNPPIFGRNWDGHWLTHEGIEPGKWYHVALVVDGATEQVEDDRMHLYINGERVDRGPGVKIPASYGAPVIGRTRTHWNNAPVTRFHDERKEAQAFTGRIDDFQMINDARPPGGAPENAR